MGADVQELSLLLFDISDVFAPGGDTDTQKPAPIFADLLRKHFPTAKSIAHLGSYHFCVLLKEDQAFDEALAINRLCAEANSVLHRDGSDSSLSTFVGRVQYDAQKYVSLDDMLRQADGMFFRHEKQPLPKVEDRHGLIGALVRWRKTIY
jgi:hypothetical protein